MILKIRTSEKLQKTQALCVCRCCSCYLVTCFAFAYSNVPVRRNVYSIGLSRGARQDPCNKHVSICLFWRRLFYLHGLQPHPKVEQNAKVTEGLLAFSGLALEMSSGHSWLKVTKDEHGCGNKDNTLEPSVVRGESRAGRSATTPHR